MERPGPTGGLTRARPETEQGFPDLIRCLRSGLLSRTFEINSEVLLRVRCSTALRF